MSSLTTINIDAIIKKDVRTDILKWLEGNNDIILVNTKEFDDYIPKELESFNRAHILNAKGFEDDDDYYFFKELMNQDYRLTFRLTSKNKDNDLEELLKFLIPYMNIQFSRAYIYCDNNYIGYKINLKKSIKEKEIGILNFTKIIIDEEKNDYYY